MLLSTWSAEVLVLIMKMRNAELREFEKDYLTMGNLEHAAVVANNLQFGLSNYYRKLMLHITDSQNAKGCINRSFSPNFVDQEMRRLASLLKVRYTFSETAIWVNTWMNLLLDLLSRLFHNDVLEQDVMKKLSTFATS